MQNSRSGRKDPRDTNTFSWHQEKKYAPMWSGSKNNKDHLNSCMSITTCPKHPLFHHSHIGLTSKIEIEKEIDKILKS